MKHVFVHFLDFLLFHLRDNGLGYSHKGLPWLMCTNATRWISTNTHLTVENTEHQCVAFVYVLVCVAWQL